MNDRKKHPDELERRERRAHLLTELNPLVTPYEISIRIPELDMLCNPLDPAPLGANSLSPEIEQYLVNSISQPQKLRPVLLKVYAPVNDEKTAELVKAVFVNHFHRRAEETLAENKRTFRQWRFNLIGGVFFLAVCMLISHIFSLPVFQGDAVFHTISESASIIGWVALWEPATFFLYGWRGSARQLARYMHLHCAHIEIIGGEIQ